MQQTVTEIIETRKLIEAKNQLTQTDKNISEIGFDLGYNERAYFTNVILRDKESFIAFTYSDGFGREVMQFSDCRDA